MNFVSIRIITADIERLVHFYEQITGPTGDDVHRRLRGADDAGVHSGDR